jgi:son of sevenless-like protein
VDQTNLKIEGFATLALTPAKNIVRLILSRLDLTTITACLQVCRTWANLQNDKTFWNMVYKHYEVRLKQRGEKNVNIWEASIEDKTIIEDKDGNIKFATLNGLVEKLTPAEHIPNTSDADALLTTYPTFTTAQQLVRKLFERYNVPPPANNKNLDEYAKNFVKPIQVRVCHILKKFVMWKYATLDTNLVNLLKVVSKLMEDRLGVTLKYTMMKESMKLTEQRATPRQSIVQKVAAPTTKPAKTGVKLLPVREKNGLLLHTNSELLAKQLTLIEFETYAVIQAQELIGESWNKKNKDQLSPNIRKMIDRFNYTTKSIVTLLLQEEKLKTRAKLFVKFIKIAAALRKINNFHTLMAVLSGLNDGPIFRLKTTKDQIPPKWLKVWEELQSLMSHEGSYVNYRHALSAAQPPCIPYIGIYLRDLVYIESTNAPEEVKVPDGIQFKQKKQVFSVIKLLQTYQEHPYAFEPNDELIQMLNTLPTVSDDELFVLSREREPKTNQPGSRESTAPGTVKPKTSGEPSRRTLNVQ